DHRDGIGLGEDWKRRLYRELREVDAVIGVVTKSSVASEWCFAELGIADARGCRLIPLRAESGVVHPLMHELQYVDYYADPQQACHRVLQTVQRLNGEGAWREGKNPFPGLESFTAELSQGRDQPVTTGWMAYFRLADSERTFRDLDGWLRRRLRQVRWKQWKTTAVKRHNLRIRGISERNARKWAGSSKGY
ncbi:MAG: group II intron maturase-specific domain-containing protein, partial [Pseudonocardiaceae bacterium]